MANVPATAQDPAQNIQADPDLLDASDSSLGDDVKVYRIPDQQHRELPNREWSSVPRFQGWKLHHAQRRERTRSSRPKPSDVQDHYG